MALRTKFKKWKEKDPDEQKDYIIKWAKRLSPGETIVSSEFILPSDLVEVLKEIDNTNKWTILWVNGGTAGTTYEIINRITTSSTPPRIFDQHVRLPVRQRRT